MLIYKTSTLITLDDHYAVKISGTTIDTDTSFRDDYPPSNLLSSEERKKRGFIAERFVRAPVSITLHFKTPIFLSHITFCTDAGQGHQSAVYELSAALYSNELQNNEFIKVGRTIICDVLKCM